MWHLRCLPSVFLRMKKLLSQNILIKKYVFYVRKLICLTTKTRFKYFPKSIVYLGDVDEQKCEEFEAVLCDFVKQQILKTSSIGVVRHDEDSPRCTANTDEIVQVFVIREPQLW